MTRRLLLALDQGTTSCRAIVFDADGRVVALAQEEFAQHYPQPGWVEHDPDEIWQVQRRVMLQAARQVGPEHLAAIGITNQRETSVVWDASTGRPLFPAIVWQCRRSAGICQRLRADGVEPLVRARTGLLLDPYFSGTKLTWLFENVPGLREKAARGEARFGTIETWLLWNLTGGRVHATDVSNASRTLLLNLETRRWDDEMLALFGVPAATLPEVRPSGGIFGETQIDGVNLPVASALGDQQAALFGQACLAPGMAKSTYGTGCFLLRQVGAAPVPPADGLLTTVAWELPDGTGAYALEGSVFIAGAALQWLRDGLGLIESAAETEALARSVPDTGGVVFVPAFTGLGAPYWNPDARGLIAGLTRGTNRAHLVRAALEAIAFQNRDVLDAMNRAAGAPIQRLRADGGAARNDFLLQFQADLLGIPVERPENAETTAFGAALMAGLAVGLWGSPAEAAGCWRAEHLFRPAWNKTRRQAACADWQRAVAYQIPREEKTP